MIPEFRRITLGSRQGPDPVDHFLEGHFLYRKHTFTDATSLFRVVSEQVYDTQVLHYEVRMECVRFMFRKRRLFERYVRGDFDDYLWRLEKTQTGGTMLELRAMCLLYARNVVIYESFQLGETIAIGDMSYRQDALRIFKDRSGHFDTVLTMPDIAMAAIGQAIAFKLLYQQLFRLPDVSLAVEAMLYPNTFNGGVKFEIDGEGNVISLLCRNGRTFKLDRPEKTRCLLTNYKICAYHNRQSQSPVPISCVRQFLADGSNPFPYVVCKSLDPYTYRNVELYCLNVARREARNLDIYMGDYNFKVGAKCQVALDPKQPRKLSICHIQHITRLRNSCVVFSEAKAQFLTVPYAALHPMPPSEFHPWDPPYRYQRSRQFRNERPKSLRIKQKEAKNRLPDPQFGLQQKTLHWEGKTITLPFPVATADDKKQPPNQDNQSIAMSSDQRAAPAAKPAPPPSLDNPGLPLDIPRLPLDIPRLPLGIPRLPFNIPRPLLPTISHQVFYSTPQPAIGSPQFMPGQSPFQPHMIRPPVRFFLMPPPSPLQPGSQGTLPGLMPLPFGNNGASMIAHTVNDFRPLSYRLEVRH